MRVFNCPWAACKNIENNQKENENCEKFNQKNCCITRLLLEVVIICQPFVSDLFSSLICFLSAAFSSPLMLEIF